MIKKKKEVKGVLSFFKYYPRSSIVFIAIFIYLLIKLLSTHIQYKWIGFGFYLVIILLILTGKARVGLEYHFSKFEKNIQDQIALLAIFVLYIINFFVKPPYSLIIYVIMAVLFLKYIFKYLFLFIDIFAGSKIKEK